MSGFVQVATTATKVAKVTPVARSPPPKRPTSLNREKQRTYMSPSHLQTTSSPTDRPLRRLLSLASQACLNLGPLLMSSPFIPTGVGTRGDATATDWYVDSMVPRITTVDCEAGLIRSLR